ncbi:5-formyltetrahydrofolate cyclo-ligase [Epithele typhae]|uniref:5-formyltetrahydrofolate cyclo-ligase n=1 Tax=Epithele typhae TaxID=378194 RepID=UPI0020074BD3|nr:5-formyltetrahydrofolate cyclo-ligase [Epithele typhae]KAH9941802.1 5-formyltetrahydrofolate cyclo-ligase [Epithele typhae]
MASVLQKQKGALRKAMRVMLASLSPEEIQAQSAQITTTLLALPEFRASRAVSCFLSMPPPACEVDTSAVVAAVLRTDKRLYVPKMTDTARGRMDVFRIFDEPDLAALPRGQWGIREPEAEYLGQARPAGIAFDRSLSRLGYGKGYYDRFLAAYAQGGAGRPKLVALALREQILVEGQVPAGELDWRVDMIVGPDGIVLPRSGSPSASPSPPPSATDAA